MPFEQTRTQVRWTTVQTYALAVICLTLGTTGGYFLRGGRAWRANPPARNSRIVPPGEVSAADLKRMADKQSQSLREQLNRTPGDPQLLANIGNVYYKSHQFTEAIEYYRRSLQTKPDSAVVNADLGNAYYYSGEVDKALEAYSAALRCDPKYADALFNTGLIQWRDKSDPNAAITTWRTLLERNPDLPQRAQVESMMANAKKHVNMQAQ